MADHKPPLSKLTLNNKDFSKRKLSILLTQTEIANKMRSKSLTPDSTLIFEVGW